MLKNEQSSNSEFLNILSGIYPGIFLYTIKNEGNSLKPFDIFGCWNGKIICLEGKYLTNKSRPTPEQVLKKLEPHQVASLYKILNVGGSPGVVCYRATKNEFIKYELTEDLVLLEVDKYLWEL